ncbi:putative dna polymerase type b [Trichonephila clavipes]|nr:putative dna polymerase type b [Trichonephila clavipes]
MNTVLSQEKTTSPYFQGVYSRDTLSPLQENMCAIVNSDDSSQPGTHWLEKDAIEIDNIYKKSKPLLPLTESEKQLYDNANNCYVCGQTFHENNIKVRDHNNVTQKFNGPCCNSRNLAMKTPKFFPVFFQNLSGYDAHIFIKELGYDEKQINLIPNTEEKYISFREKQLNSAGEKQLNSAPGTKQLDSTGGNNSTRQEKTTQLGSRNEATQLSRRNQLYPSAGTKQRKSALPSSTCNRRRPQERNNSTVHCRRPPAPPLRQNRLFLPTDDVLHTTIPGHKTCNALSPLLIYNAMFLGPPNFKFCCTY